MVRPNFVTGSRACVVIKINRRVAGALSGLFLFLGTWVVCGAKSERWLSMRKRQSRGGFGGEPALSSVWSNLFIKCTGELAKHNPMKVGRFYITTMLFYRCDDIRPVAQSH